jgi:hypothetical protein
MSATLTEFKSPRAMRRLLSYLFRSLRIYVFAAKVNAEHRFGRAI